MARAVIMIILFVKILNVQSLLNLPEGAACFTYDNYPGTCMLWKKCYSIIADRNSNNYPTVCSYKEKDPVICCTSCHIVDDVSKVVLDPTGSVLWKTSQKSWNQCLDYVVTAPYDCKKHHKPYTIKKVWIAEKQCFATSVEPENYSEKYTLTGHTVGGRDARRFEFPHMALLGYGSSKDLADWLCGGTIITNRFILTAAHCTIASGLGPVKYAALGILKRSHPVKFWRIYEIQRIVPYPKYKRTSKYHDIALLKTALPISFDKNVLPACLPHLNMTASDYEADATGWGALGYTKPLANTLQTVRLTKFNRTRCSQLYPQNQLKQGYDHSIQMCYGAGDEILPRDTCKGDSGGPLQISGQASACQKTVIGVTSHGSGCGFVKQAGMYTRVKPYVPWIESVVWP